MGLVCFFFFVGVRCNPDTPTTGEVSFTLAIPPLDSPLRAMFLFGLCSSPRMFDCAVGCLQIVLGLSIEECDCGVFVWCVGEVILTE